MTSPAMIQPAANSKATTATRAPAAGAADPPRNYLGQRYVYVKFSPRARGLSVGVNLNPDKECNFDCAYCDVDRPHCTTAPAVDLGMLASELRRTLEEVHSGQIAQRLLPARLPADLLQLRMVAISGEGEPTLCLQFEQAVETIIHVRAQGRFPHFKIALLTNGSRLRLPEIQAGLRQFKREDEIWIKLDAGTAPCFDLINRPEGCRFEDLLTNILHVARQRPVIIQSLFPLFRNEPPPQCEIDAYAQRLGELKDQGAQIALVQVYSVSRPSARPGATHLPLRNLSQIARTVRETTGLRAEVF